MTSIQDCTPSPTPLPTLNATTATPFAGSLPTPDPNRRGPRPTQTIAGPPPTEVSLPLAGPSGSSTDLQDSVVEVTPTPTPSGPRALASSDTPLQQALVVAGAPPNDRSGGGSSGGAGGASSGGDASSSSLPGGLDSNIVLLLSLLAALGVPAVAIGGRIYQIRRQ